MPEWLKEHIDQNCPYCGAPMEELYNNEGKCTNRRCTNFYECPGHNAEKGAIMFKLFGVEGVGVATCLNNIKNNNFKTHLQLLDYVPANKRKQKLSTILRALCLDGIDMEWVKVCEQNNIYTLEDLAKLPPDLMETIRACQNVIVYMLTKLEIDTTGRIEDLANEYQYIMITGYVKGYPTKEDYIDFLNKKYGKYIRTLHQTTAKKSGVAALIKEPETNTMTKFNAAKQAGIPIYTSENFTKYMTEKYENKNEEAARAIPHE